jgi:energy-coupling factor transporter ATP-binding protein EcfA2
MPDYYELERQLEEQLARTSRFRRMAFHVHSPDSHDWGRDADRELNDRGRFVGSEGIDAFLDALAEHLDIVCITDHMKSGLACELSRRAQNRADLELLVFPGVEVSCRVPPGHTDAIHLLVVFPAGTQLDVIERVFADQPDLASHGDRTGHEDIRVDSLVAWGRRLTAAGALFVFAHIDQPQRGHRAYVRRRRGESMEMMGGDLDDEAERAISHEYAEHLVELAPSAVEVKEGGEDREHYAKFTTADGRVHKVAAVARSDHHAIEEFANKKAVTYVKVSRADFECVSDALRFFSTRIRFDEDLPAAPSPRIVGIRLRSTGHGLFEDATLAFNENLNCLIGPRGCGKSTVVEALRYVLGQTPELDSAAEGEGPESSFARLALSTQEANLADTQIELIYEIGGGQRFLLGATYDGAEPVTSRVFSLEGEDRHVGADALPTEFPARMFSWSEIETLGRRPQLQRQLIDRLAEPLPTLLSQRDTAHAAIVENREDIERLLGELGRLKAADDGALRRYQEYKAAFELLNTDEVRDLFAELDAAREQVELLDATSEYLQTLATRVSDLQGAFKEDPTEELLKKADDRLREWFESGPPQALHLGDLIDAGRQHLSALAQEIARRLEDARRMLRQAQDAADRREAELRERTKAEPGQSIRRDQREEARQRYATSSANRERYQHTYQRLREALERRRTLVEAHRGVEDSMAAARAETAEALTGRLGALGATDSEIKIDVRGRADRDALARFYDGFLNLERGGHYREKRLAERLASLEPAKVAGAILDGETDALIGDGALEDAEAQRLVSAFELFSHDDDADVEVIDDSLLEVIKIEEQTVDDAVKILSDGAPVETLSPGGRSSAMLPLIAMAETVPLIIDQPEDNLDNRMVGRTLTSILAELKERRQIIVTTHNPNIVVGGDAEQVLVLDAPHAREARLEDTGSIDDDAIIEHVIRIMEGGKEAFEERERRYEGHLS